MVNKIKKFSMLSVLMVLGVMFFVACTKPQRITLSAENNATSLQPGQSIVLTNTIWGELNEEELTYVATGDATVINNTLTVDSDAEVGSRIEVYSKIGLNKSNTLVFSVGHLHIEELHITSSRLELSANTETTLNVAVLPENATAKNYNFRIVKGEEFADVLYNTITKTYSLSIKNVEFEDGEKVVVQVYSENNNEIFDEIEFTLVEIDNEIYAETLTISSDQTELSKNQSALLNVNVLPQNATVKGYGFSILQGEEFAEVVYSPITKNYFLRVKDVDFVGGEKVVVQVYAEHNSSITDEIEVTLIVIDNEIYTTSLNLTANKTSLYEGEEAVLNVEVLPQNATVRDFSFEILNGNENYAEVVYSQSTKLYTLKAKNNNLQENKIIVVRVFNDFDNEIYSDLEFEIVANTVRYITLSSDKYFINTKAGVANINLNATAYDRNFTRILNQGLEYSVVSGTDFLEVDTNGYLNGTGHGVAVVRVTAVNDENIFAEAEVTVVNPPERLELPSNLATKTDIDFAYSLRTRIVYGDPKDENDPPQPTLAFIPFEFDVTVLGTGNHVNKAVVYTFKNGANTGEDVAVYNYQTNEITFKKTGKTVITATSYSNLNGYTVNPIFETSVSFTVNVNNGFNVNTYEQFKYYMEHLEWTDKNNPTINILSNLKPTADNLALGVNQNAITAGSSRIINGNGFEIDVTEQAYTGGSRSLIQIWNSHGKNISAEIYNLSIYGNYGIDGDIENEDKVNANAIRIYGYRNNRIGDSNEYGSSYVENVVISNVHVYGFREGMYLRHVVNGLVTDSSVSNTFFGGILSSENIIEFKNMTYSNIGHFGLYITPNETENVAGKNFNQVSQVKISGYTYIDNLNNGTTKGLLSFEQFFSQYGAEGITSMLGSGIVKYIEANDWNGKPQAANIISHFRNDNDEYNMFSIAFLDSPEKIFRWGSEGNRNGAIVNFQTDELMGSMINISDLDGENINTTHKFIVVDAVTTIGALGGGEYILGQMILVNLHYQA